MIQVPNRNYNRRDILRLGAAAGLAPLFTRWAAAAQDAKDSDTFTFIVANDIHYFDKRCAAWLGDHVIQRMNDHKADFCAIVGDMSEDGTKEQNAAIRDVLPELGPAVKRPAEERVCAVLHVGVLAPQFRLVTLAAIGELLAEPGFKRGGGVVDVNERHAATPSGRRR